MFSSLSNLLDVPNLTKIAGGNSGVARTLRTSAFTRPTAAKRAFQPVKTNFAPALGARLATTSALDGKIHQVIGAVVDGTWSTLRSRALHSHYRCEALLAQTNTEVSIGLVKFETDTLPPILNALTTENNGQKLILEVAVSLREMHTKSQYPDPDGSNIWVKMSYEQLLWMVSLDIQIS